MAFLGMFTKYQFITWEHKKCYWTSWYYRGYKKSITEQIQIARRKLVEFKRSKEIVPYTGIQEAAFQDVWGAKQHMYITKKMNKKKNCKLLKRNITEAKKITVQSSWEITNRESLKY